ncbi:hypothetical protein A2867_04880 [Candidatus Daviesbacteria bacterium RIFCSPHIGHO2_01_FULL_40_11]|uniref:Uncharacterized protein n=1 Tax=Candidatus Daviesbacteria bacterium RIFCSPHIGHO2_01_FULL_40_11 TaxID=1797762 RepID=A0A1F5JI82_9BACT|nr:MAG: hypothetical protein A2867_04880 [Candidatus Daviesbacteria bacterium RIFCSPHIGHO2_01_FULL_40_11]OGE62944.1 MAG: hypothetical protein A2964_00375 [Candidatus Daviesbacteria bacterium RIFCSPLOWO2_01_FULL_40_27]
MPTTTPTDTLDFEITMMLLKVAILIILVFYAIFALIVVRQVDLMSKTLITKVSPILKAFSIIHAGFAIGLIVLAWGIL